MYFFLTSKRKVRSGEKWKARQNVRVSSKVEKGQRHQCWVFIWGFSEFTQLIRKSTSTPLSWEKVVPAFTREFPGSPKERLSNVFCFHHACNTESQNDLGWKGPYRSFNSNPQPQAGTSSNTIPGETSLHTSCPSSEPCHIWDLLAKAAESQSCGLGAFSYSCSSSNLPWMLV